MRTAIEDVGVNLRRLDVTMPKQLLHGTNVVACLQKMGGKAVAQRLQVLRAKLWKLIEQQTTEPIPTSRWTLLS